MEEQIMNMPAVALRGLTILPGMIAHFDISRERSLRAVEEAMEQDQKIYLVTQRNVDSEDPTQEDLYQMGIVADIKQVVRLQNDVVRILVDGISRAALLGFTGNEKYLEAEICYCDSNADSLPDDLREAMLLGVREAFHRYAAVVGKISKELIRQIDQYEDLEKLIEDLTGDMCRIFAESFVIINNNFKSIFTELFGGGKAELVLTDPENVLESGIEIRVAPPGKVIKNLISLSGGEQSFVAICIYFAILKLKPAPFCILDEIDAALDEVNVKKYAQYLKKFTDKTQFVLVTHRRSAMEEANVLYGVTMQEDGISKLLKMEQVDIENTAQ